MSEQHFGKAAFSHRTDVSSYMFKLWFCIYSHWTYCKCVISNMTVLVLCIQNSTLHSEKKMLPLSVLKEVKLQVMRCKYRALARRETGWHTFYIRHSERTFTLFFTFAYKTLGNKDLIKTIYVEKKALKPAHQFGCSVTTKSSNNVTIVWKG